MSKQIQNAYSLLSITFTCLILVHSTNCIGIKRVGIVGSGIGGLGFAASLKKICQEVEVVDLFEERSDYLQARLGGGVQLSGGAVVLEKLGCLGDFKKFAERLESVRTRTADGQEILFLDVKKAVTANSPQDLCDMTGDPIVFTVMRDALQNHLYKQTQTKIPSSPHVRIYAKKKCVKVLESNGKVSIRFEDGSECGDYDMVIGADGVKSVLRSYVQEQNFNFLPSIFVESKYSGIRITYCLTDPDPSFALRKDAGTPSCRGRFHQWFGNGLYTLCGSYGGIKGPQHMVAAVYRDERDANRGENPQWQSLTETAKNDKTDETTASLLERLEGAGFSRGRHAEIFGIAEAAAESRVFDLGVRDRLLPLPSWSSRSGRVVLLGDAAHSMAPFLGQGANQALQDGFTLASLIQAQTAVGNNGGDASVKSLATEFEKRRKLSTALLSVKSSFLGNVETLRGPVGMGFRDNFFRFTGATGIAEREFLNGAVPRL